MKVLVIGYVDMGKTTLIESAKNHDIIVIEPKEMIRPKEEIFLIHEQPMIEPVKYFPEKEQQPWKQRRVKNNWKNKRKK